MAWRLSAIRNFRRPEMHSLKYRVQLEPSVPVWEACRGALLKLAAHFEPMPSARQEYCRVRAAIHLLAAFVVPQLRVSEET